ncbi:hypothetical protein BJ878DRAFT_304018 [Calycina marina]|uniref:Fe2OG dioxygenase domain-containing protein n=1 Tax=Calycina marina TaxID=1763456 RepID=A0A9P7YW16_9HELO|nr:hypothetical protein BJ878DRAFT_304018 [Calycina marina]
MPPKAKCAKLAGEAKLTEAKKVSTPGEVHGKGLPTPTIKEPSAKKVATPKIPKIPEVPKAPRSLQAPDRSKAPTASTADKAVEKALLLRGPRPYGQPVMWADSRQGLCETCPQFRAFQGGIYCSGAPNHLVHGLLVDGGSGPRDIMTEEVLVTRAGGSRAVDANGQHQYNGNQTGDSRFVKGFQNAMTKMTLVLVIAGSNKQGATCQMPHRYSVLGWFVTTDVWCEIENGYTAWMVRLQKADLKNKSWFADAASGPTPLSATLEPVTVPIQICRVCLKSTCQIYEQGWACLDIGCEAHFKFFVSADDGPEEQLHVDAQSLRFTQAFLNYRVQYNTPDGSELPPIAPPLPTDEDKLGIHGFEQRCKEGIVCPECGCCSRRIYWDRWECDNVRREKDENNQLMMTKNCHYVHRVKQYPMSVADAQRLSSKPPKALCQPLVGVREFYNHAGYHVTIYDLPGDSGEMVGSVSIFKSDAFINARSGGANDIFGNIQLVDLGLKRNPCKKDSKGAYEVVTAHWSANFGADYKFHVKQESIGFQHAPPVIVDATKMLVGAGKAAVGADSSATAGFTGFNECLAVGYFANAHMGYHDDGEAQLGPTVASLSLGGLATMQWRPKKKSGGCGLKKGKLAYTDMLSVRIQHGDIMVMHGAGIQKCYEHKVDPHGSLRFALTSRYICPEALSDDERAAAIVDGALPSEDAAIDA